MSKEQLKKGNREEAQIVGEAVNDSIIAEEALNDIAINDIVNEISKEPEKKIGFVSDCEKLNVRMAPSLRAEVICKVDAGTELEILEDESANEFYKVCLASGAEGFCMKKYITIK